jgi:hypothetical protein
MVGRFRRRREARLDASWQRVFTEEAASRQDSAEWLLDHQPFLAIEAYSEDWPGPDGATYAVGLHEIAGHEFPELMDGTVAMLTVQTGVREVLQEDAEVIHIWSESWDAASAEGELRNWWTNELEKIAHPSGD